MNLLQMIIGIEWISGPEVVRSNVFQMVAK
jgi:hypothetical protein